MPTPPRPFFASSRGLLLSLAVIGVLAVLLEKAGNPPNMGLCVVCFQRDIAGALGLHRATPVQALRPEIPAIVLGALLAALLSGEFRPRNGSSPVVRFLLGVFASVGALVFLGCTWRLLLRLSALDGSALGGLAGFLAGVAAACAFLARGYRLQEDRRPPVLVGWLLPGLMLLLLAATIWPPRFGRTGVVFSSWNGPGAACAPVWLSLAAGLVIGALLQRTRFCTVGAVRDAALAGSTRGLKALAALVAAAFVVRVLLGLLSPGFAARPVAHSDHFWNFLGMALAGMAFTMAGGCPARQLVAAGEGNADAGVFVLGALAGGAFAHNFALAAAPDHDGLVGGPMIWGRIAVLAGLGFCVLLGLFHRAR